MPDRYWCTACDVGYTSMTDGNCPHCGSSLQDMEGPDDASDNDTYEMEEEMSTGRSRQGFEDGVADRIA